MRIETFVDGIAICADGTDPAVVDAVHAMVGDIPLVIADPPYGNVLAIEWDRVNDNDDVFSDWMVTWTRLWQCKLAAGAAFYTWGGIGRPGFRPFFKYLVKAEQPDEFLMSSLITWSKRRAYGIKWGYLFTREELAYFIKGDDIKKPRCFNVPLLETKRGYAGYNAKYPAKSEFYRRTNVWTDITEIMHGKVHDAQKAQRVIEIPIEVHTVPGEWVVDPFAGAGTTAHAARKLRRRFIVIEKDEKTFDEMVARLRVNKSNQGVVLEHEQDVTQAPSGTRQDTSG